MKLTKDNWITKAVDWEELGYGTMLASNDETSAIDVCRCHLQAYELRTRPEIVTLNVVLGQIRAHALALHGYLYDRPIPVDDASMLTHRSRIWILVALCLLTAGACLVGNFTTFLLFGWGIAPALGAGIFITALPLGLGHLAYEKILSGNRVLQVVLVAVTAILGFAGFFEFGQARRTVIDKVAASAANSYVEGDAGSDPPQGPQPEESEAQAKSTLGRAAFLMTAAAEIALGFLVGLFGTLWTDKDYAAWRKLKIVLGDIADRDGRVAALRSSLDEAKNLCMAGLRRAQDARNRRHAPYHQALVLLLIFVFVRALPSQAQAQGHEEITLLDTSASEGASDVKRDLFRECVGAAKRLVASEPSNTRIWVSTISNESFGGVHEVLKGRTPEAHGVFHDDLDRARRQLAMNFEVKSAGLTPTASGTDIFGGLWHAKTLFEPVPETPDGAGKTIWILSDMMNETREFPMPRLLDIGPERMLERAKMNGLVVPLSGYRIHVYGASTAGLTPRAWMTIKRFWELYFSATGAELVTYSITCELER
ncbi:MAG: hypothetical protein WAN65_03690 [Candidatus Sulfotelmatobacter sp.]